MYPSTFVRTKQQLWARRTGKKASSASYLSNVNDNLFKPLKPETASEFDDADGGELKPRGTSPAKMCALHSSSAPLCPTGCIPAAVAREMITQLATTFDRLKLDSKTQVTIQHIATDIVAMVNLATSGDRGDQIVMGLKHLLRKVFGEISLKSVSAE